VTRAGEMTSKTILLADKDFDKASSTSTNALSAVLRSEFALTCESVPLLIGFADLPSPRTGSSLAGQCVAAQQMPNMQVL
jgi:hypothetical protein